MGDDPADKFAAFRLLPVDKPKSRDNTVHDCVFVRLESVATKECVRPSTAGEEYKRSEVTTKEGCDPSLSKRMQGLKWDDSTLVVATTAAAD